MKNVCVVAMVLLCVSIVNASPLGTYIYDSFNGTYTAAVDANVWVIKTRADATHPAGPSRASSVFIDTTRHSLMLNTGFNSYPGAMVQGKNAAVKPDAGQQVVLSSSKAHFITDFGHAWGLMVPGGDRRGYPDPIGSSWVSEANDTDYILLHMGWAGWGNTLELHMRKANGTVFKYEIVRGLNQVIDGTSPAIVPDVNAVFELHWSNGLVYLTIDGNVVYDSRVNGGFDSIPSIPLTAYAAASHSTVRLYEYLDDIKLEVVSEVMPPLPPLSSDINKDGKTNFKDYSLLAGNWQQTLFPAGLTPMAAGVYLYDTFQSPGAVIDVNLWDTHDSSLVPNTDGSVYIYDALNRHALVVIAGANQQVVPGALITSKLAVHPEGAQDVVLSSSNVEYRINPDHCWGLMIEGGDTRAKPNPWPHWDYTDTDYILLWVNLPDPNYPDSYTMEVRMRKDEGSVFKYAFRSGLRYGSSHDYGHTIHWSPNRVYVVEEGVTVFDTAVNGGASSIPTVDMTVYAAASFAYNCNLYDDFKLEIVEPTLTGDVKRDRKVDMSDIAELAGHWLVSTL